MEGKKPSSLWLRALGTRALYSGSSLFLPLPHNSQLTPPNRHSHEIAYVFGQLSSPHSVPSLVTVLKKEDEEDMVRHEAAEALGGIATDDCLPVLEEMSKKEGVPRVVRESCEVALDMVSPLALLCHLDACVLTIIAVTV